MFDAIIRYIFNNYDPGLIIILIMALYFYTSTLNKLTSIVITKDDVEKFNKESKLLSNKIDILENNVQTLFNSLNNFSTEVEYQLNAIREVLSSIEEGSKTKKKSHKKEGS